MEVVCLRLNLCKGLLHCRKDDIVPAMASFHILNAVALASLALAATTLTRCGGASTWGFWVSNGIALVATAAWSFMLLIGGWQAEFGTALWIIVSAATALYIFLAIFTHQAWRLGPLLMPYLSVLGLIASVVRGEPKPMVGGAPAIWIDLHICVAVLIFALLTLASVSSLAVFLQECALKSKKKYILSKLLPSVADSEMLSVRLLEISEVVLLVGLASGMAIQYFETGDLIRFDHKVLFSVAAFILIGILLLGHRVCGVRGRSATRLVLVAYLLVILASPGVKFVTQVLL